MDKIVDHSFEGSGWYYVKWYGWPNSQNTWEPKEAFEEDVGLKFVQDYFKSEKKR